MNTEVSVENFKGNDYVSIWELDAKGVRFPKPLISMGKKKVQAVEKHLDEIKQLLGIVKNENDPF